MNVHLGNNHEMPDATARGRAMDAWAVAVVALAILLVGVVLAWNGGTAGSHDGASRTVRDIELEDEGATSPVPDDVFQPVMRQVVAVEQAGGATALAAAPAGDRTAARPSPAATNTGRDGRSTPTSGIGSGGGGSQAGSNDGGGSGGSAGGGGAGSGAQQPAPGPATDGAGAVGGGTATSPGPSVPVVHLPPTSLVPVETQPVAVSASEPVSVQLGAVGSQLGLDLG